MTDLDSYFLRLEWEWENQQDELDHFDGLSEFEELEDFE